MTFSESMCLSNARIIKNFVSNHLRPVAKATKKDVNAGHNGIISRQILNGNQFEYKYKNTLNFRSE